MDNNQNKPEEQLAEGPQSAEEEQPEFRKISEEELKKILENHLKYLESGGKDGKKANLYKADLSGTNLSGADLSGANLSGAKLSEANLSEANLSGADLSGAHLSEAIISKTKLSEANLSGTNLRGRYLRGANFSGAKLSEANLSGSDLGGANLSEANLSGTNLSGTYFIGAKLSEANLSGADLSGAHLSRAKLSGAKLSGAYVTGADFSFSDGLVLSGTYVTDMRFKIKGCQEGVNGFYHKKSDSAALMTLTPPGNSMQGPNPDAVIESLKRARRLHGFSMSLVGIVILIAILNLTEIKFPWADNVKVTPSQFGLLAMPMSIGLLILVGSFISDALKGARYLQDRSSAMTVGNFPWSLSKYAGQDKIAQFLSFIARMVMSFHPIIYIFILGLWQVFNPIVFYILSIITLALCGWVLFLSEQFQKPILFDRKTEEEKKDNIEKLTEAVERQTEKLDKLVEIFKSNEDQNNQEPDSHGETSNGTKT